MFFKNLRAYRLPARWGVTREQLETWLSRYPFRPCGDLEMQTRGWLAPTDSGELVYAVDGQWIICLGLDTRLLPATIINQAAEQRAKEIEAQQGYTPGRKQMREIKERVADELMPKSHCRRSRVWAWIDPTAGWLCIDAASAGKADALLEMLGKSSDELPLSRLKTRVSPASAMAAWLADGEIPGGLMFLDILKEAAEKQAKYASEQFDANVAIMTGELVRMLADLVKVLGGELEG